MIVVGILMPGAPSTAAVVEIARRAAATGARTEIVGVAPAGAAGDRQLVELAAAGVGHATVTRSGAAGVEPGTAVGIQPGTVGIEPADLELALRYLPDIRAIVLVEPDEALLATASAASAWSGTTLIVVGTAEADYAATGSAASGSATTAEPIVLQPPARDPDGAFAGLVAALAVRLDAGEVPAVAWQATLAALAVDPA
ncbi:MAG TPA: hypothetical protein VMQ65_11940 [Candidatus Limnocylindria bacterium]|nr:hypothetical protein [Candidatus Limnocylindria bacterium]